MLLQSNAIQLHVKNFRNLRDFTLDLRPGLTVILGENNIGKTNLLDALRLALTTAYGNDSVRLTTDDLTRPGTENTITVSLRFDGLTVDDQVEFLDLLNYQPPNSTASPHFTATYNPGTERWTTRRWGGEHTDTDGGIPEDGLTPCRWYRRSPLSCVYPLPSPLGSLRIFLTARPDLRQICRVEFGRFCLVFLTRTGNCTWRCTVHNIRLRPTLLVLLLSRALFPTNMFAAAICTAGPSCPGFSATPLPFIPPVFEGQTMPLPAPVTAGDVVVYDDPQMMVISDVLRFIPSAGGMATSYILFSDPPDPEDLGIPILLSNQFLMVEAPPLTYTAGPNTYPINSDLETGPPDAQVPEPRSVALLVVGVVLMSGWAASLRRMQSRSFAWLKR